ncbi:GntR family transcriptional regulator [Tateyamaria sp.]|uniref:GntR family transcriptional regulator n=1 Tax=Tateyamaria sp. TaxID=1929288 RepID=UPI0032A05F11
MKSYAVDISKSASAATIVFEALRQAIIDGELQDGMPLRQDEIAKTFNTSRIPVREAITMLEVQGFVSTQRFKGAVVAGLSRSDASEIFEFRALVEGTVIERAVSDISPEALARARGFFEAFSTSTDPMEWGNLNREFHYELYNASELSYHLKIINNSLDRVDRYLRAQITMTDGKARANEEHGAILEACEKGQASLASDLTKAHILGARDTLLEVLK